MTTIGTKKTLRDGKTIEFTRKNPTTTFNAIEKYLKGKGFETYDKNYARTGSRYLSMYCGAFEIDVRCANHTQGYDSDREVKLRLSGSDSGIISIEIDLSHGNMGINEFKALFEEVYNLNVARAAKGMIARFKADGDVSGLNEIASEGVIEKVVEYLNENQKYL